MADYDLAALEPAVTHFLEHSKVKSNGVREVPTADYYKVLGEQGVTKDDVTRVMGGIHFVNTAAAEVAFRDLETKIGEASKDDLEKEEFRTGLKAVVRLPTFGGATEVEAKAETWNNIPFRGDADGNGEATRKPSYGRLRTSINSKSHIHRDFSAQADARMRKALGVELAD